TTQSRNSTRHIVYSCRSSSEPGTRAPRGAGPWRSAMTVVLRFEFDEGVSAEEIRDLAAVAETATEGITGPTALRLEQPLQMYEDERAVEIDDASEAGKALARVFSRLAERGVGAMDFRVSRVRRPDGGLGGGDGRWGSLAG